MTRIFLILFSMILVLPAAAQDETPQGEMTPEAFEAQLTYKTGTIDLGGVATLNLKHGYRYLDPEDTRRVLVEAWGNPSAYDQLGMIFPADLGPMDDAGWGVVISYEADGYVEDDEADDIDYDEMLAELKAGTAESSKEREEMGYGSIDLVGWAEAPSYDRANHKLYWAKEIKFDNNEVNTLNYDIRVLGRKGVLVMQAVSSMDQFMEIKPAMAEIVHLAEFNEGMRYQDFDSSVDKVAAYGIGALVAGKVAAKAGFFKILLGILLAGKKFVIIGVVALAAFVSKIFGRKNEADAA